MSNFKFSLKCFGCYFSIVLVAQSQNIDFLSSQPDSPAISGKINGMDVIARGNSVAFFASELKNALPENHDCLGDLHCTMQQNKTSAVVLTPEGLTVFKNDPFFTHSLAAPQKSSSSVHSVFVSTEFIQPSMTLATLSTGDPVIDQTESIVWVNQKTMEWMSMTLNKLNSLPTPSVDFDENIDFSFVQSSTKDTSRVLTSIATSSHGNLMSTTAVPTPTPSFTRDGSLASELTVEFERDYLTFTPGATLRTYSQSGSAEKTTGTTFSYHPKVVPTGTVTGSGTKSAGQIEPSSVSQASSRTRDNAPMKTNGVLAAYGAHWRPTNDVVILDDKQPPNEFTAELRSLENNESIMVRVVKADYAIPGKIHGIKVLRQALGVRQKISEESTHRVSLTEFREQLPLLEKCTLKFHALYLNTAPNLPRLETGQSFGQQLKQVKDAIDIQWKDFIQRFREVCLRERRPINDGVQHAFYYQKYIIYVSVLTTGQTNPALMTHDTHFESFEKVRSLEGKLIIKNPPMSLNTETLGGTFNFSGMAYGIGGVDHMIKKFIEEVIIPRLLPDRLKLKAESLSRGGIMSGVPGTGKTLLISAFGEILKKNGFKVTIRKYSGSEVFSSFVGASEQAVREMLATPPESADIVLVLIDEADAMLRKRGAHASTSGVGDSVVNQFLSALDGIDKKSNLLVFGTTNRPDLLDPAVTRFGRMSMQMKFELPDKEGRRQIFQVHTQELYDGQLLADDVSLDELAKITQGYTGAEIAQVVGKAYKIAINREQGILMEASSFSPKAITEMSVVEVTADDFRQALAEIPPRYGKGNFMVLDGRSFDYYAGAAPEEIARLKEVLDRFRENTSRSTLRILIRGPECSGKSTLAALAADYFGADFCEYLPASEVVQMSNKKEPIVSAFSALDAQPDHNHNVVVIDDFDTMIQFQNSGVFNTDLVSVVDAYSKQSLKKDKQGKLLVIVTATGDERFLPRIFGEGNTFRTYVEESEKP